MPSASAPCELPLYIPIPIIAQSTPVTCGLACMDSVLKYWGRPSPGELALGNLFLSGWVGHGLFSNSIVSIAQYYGLNAQVRDNSTLADLAAFLSNGETVILSWFFVDSGHYAVLAGIDGTFIYLMDPWKPLGYKRLYHAQFLRSWYYGAAFQGRAIRISPRPLFN